VILYTQPLHFADNEEPHRRAVRYRNSSEANPPSPKATEGFSSPFILAAERRGILAKENKLLEELSSTLSDIFKLPVSILRKSLPLDQGYDSVRNQFNSTWILSRLLEITPDGDCKVLGVTSVDLYVPVLTLVFGEAQLGGKVAVVSSYRLRDELYGLPKNPERLRERLEKEAIHELGHTFGLIHCREPRCVMYSYTYAEEIDLKFKDFCKTCAFILQNKKKGANHQTPNPY
jgi:archaemetzincin